MYVCNRLYSNETNPPPPIPSTNALVVDPPSSAAPYQPPYSAMYDNLNTNLPTTIMSYRDIPFPSNSPLFPNRKQVIDYIQHVAEKYELLPMIRFNTTVVTVQQQPEGQESHNDNKRSWQVSVTYWHDGKKTNYTESFDAIVVANGKYYVPYIPDMDGLKEFSNVANVLHSQNYRRPQDYKDKVVLVVGNGSSAADLVREISTTATKVYHCIRGEESNFSKTIGGENKPNNVQRVGGLAQFDASTGMIRCQDGQYIENVDTVLFATGYLYSFPFLSFEKDNLITDGHTVFNLFQDMFYIKNPTLAFVGLPTRVVPMPFMQMQSMVIARCFSGRAKFPSHKVIQEEMEDKKKGPKNLIMDIESELAAFERMGAWAEGYQGKIEDWQSNDPITGRLSEKWIKDRHRQLELRKEYLGY
ncbi:flavin-binding monooxygenase-like-domain-containing protein [Circinella umbellata]|nr:flavin-binding monooxygenase-like-domain-containing protein [Circinella umbellata]